MLSILSITGPIYLAILVGFAAVRAGLFKANDMRLLGAFVLYMALPSLLFSAVSSRSFGEIFRLDYILAYTIGSLLMITIGYVFSRLVMRQTTAKAGISTMGMSCPNSGFVGYPLGQLIYPDFAGIVLALNMLVENVVVIPILLALAGQEKGAGARAAFLKAIRLLIRNPLVIALVAGLCVALTPFSLPVTVSRTVELFAASAAPVALFVIGGTLAGLTAKGIWKDAVPIVIGKLIVHPVAVIAGISIVQLSGFLSLGELEIKALIITGALPVITVYTILAQSYGQEEMSAVALIGTTAASFFTLSALLWLLGF